MTRILVLQMNRMAELLLTTPALSALRKNRPDAHIALAIDHGCRELLPAFGFVDESFIISRKQGNRAFWQKLIFSSFDICLDFTGNDRSAVCSVLSKARQRITFQSVSKSQLLPLFYNVLVNSSARERHTAEHYLDLLQPLNITSSATEIALDLPSWAQKKAQQLMDETGLGEKYVMVHPGTTRPEKHWLPDRWAEVIDFCQNELGLPCVVTGADTPPEREYIAQIRPANEFHNLTGRTDLLSLAALAKRAHLLLTVDSVAMHLGSAFGSRQIALFGKTNSFHWGPRHGKAHVVQAGQLLSDQPFHHRQQGAPMSEISTKQVIDAIGLSLT